MLTVWQIICLHEYPITKCYMTCPLPGYLPEKWTTTGCMTGAPGIAVSCCGGCCPNNGGGKLVSGNSSVKRFQWKIFFCIKRVSYMCGNKIQCK